MHCNQFEIHTKNLNPTSSEFFKLENTAVNIQIWRC